MTKTFPHYLTSCALSMAVLSVSAFTPVREQISINDSWKFSSPNDSSISAVHLPHSWNSDAYSTRNYLRGKCIYTHTLHIPANLKNKRIFLRTDGAASASEISIDGKDAGKFTGAYSSHTLDITPFVTPGKDHNLTIAIDNSRRDIPPYSADFSFMGGLYRDTWVIATSDIHLDIADGTGEGFFSMPVLDCDGNSSLGVKGEIINERGHQAKVKVKVTLTDCKGVKIADKTENVTLPADRNIPFNIDLKNLSGIKAWTPENPVLYDVNVEISENGSAIDNSHSHTGFRTFGFDKEGRFLLNGKPYKLRGMCRHQDQKPMGIALTDEQHRRDMMLTKEMGANFIRISHYPQDDAILEMCDRLGLIAWEEIPVIDYVPDTEGFDNNCETMLRDMIRRHKNHPSIAMWGYMNEILLRMPRKGQDETRKRTLNLANRLENVVREEDPSRITAMAFHGSDTYHGAGLADITDVKGWNLYQGWYGGKFTDFENYLSRQHREHPDHKLIVSEYGAGSDLRIHSFEPTPFGFSMEYQQDYLEHYLPVIEDSSFVAGASHWNLIDFSSANRAESMPHINNKGILTNDRRKKDVFYYFASLWHDPESDTIVHIATDDWKMRKDITDAAGNVTHPVKIYTNLPEILLTVNGQILGKRSVENCNAVFQTPLHAGKNILTVSSPDNPEKILDTAEIELEGIPLVDGLLDLSESELAVNVGSSCFFRSDESGMTWLPDRTYTSGSGFGNTGGKRNVSQDEIALTDDGPLLQNSLKGLSEYRFDVTPGEYEIEMSFAELSSPSEQSAYLLGHNSGSGDNSWTDMDITINNRQVEHAFSPGNTAGAKTMVKKRYITTATGDKGVTVTFTPGKGTTSLAAIKIRKL